MGLHLGTLVSPDAPFEHRMGLQARETVPSLCFPLTFARHGPEPDFLGGCGTPSHETRHHITLPQPNMEPAYTVLTALERHWAR